MTKILILKKKILSSVMVQGYYLVTAERIRRVGFLTIKFLDSAIIEIMVKFLLSRKSHYPTQALAFTFISTAY